MKKLKHEAELFKAALLAGVQYAEGRGAVEFEATDSASDKALYVYRLLVLYFAEADQLIVTFDLKKGVRKHPFYLRSGFSTQLNPGTATSCHSPMYNRIK